MGTMIAITCPECKKQLKGPEELLGKQVRCKACKSVFTVKATAPEPEKKKTAPVAAKAKSTSAKKTAPAPAAPAEKPAKKDDALPYQLTDIVLTPRCPQCAAEMDEAAIICLNCGYNTQTRARIQSIRTYETSAAEYLTWLMPGMACALVDLLCLGGVAFIWLVLRRWQDDVWWAHFSIQVYGTFMFLWIGWKAGKFAFKRLILNPTPPERIRHYKD
jgi:hypothetical protein